MPSDFRKARAFALLVPLICAFIWARCAAQLDVSGPGEPSGMATEATSQLRVLVLELGRRPVAGARVSFRGVEALSDAQGVAQLTVPGQGRLVLDVWKKGYVPAVAVLWAQPQQTTETQATLLQENTRQAFVSERGARLSAGEVEVDLPPAAFVDEQGKRVAGWIEATITVVDPEQLRTQALPWPLEAMPPPQEPGAGAALPQMLASERMADFSFRQAGKEVHLAPGKEATLRMSLGAQAAAALTADDLNQENPFWHFEHEKGYWKREGSCVVRQGERGRKYCEGRVSHFSPWNLDRPKDRNTCVRFRVVDARTKRPLPSAQVLLQSVEYSYADSLYTGSDGSACANFDAGSTVRGHAELAGYMPSTEEITKATGAMGNTCEAADRCAQVTLEMCPVGIDCGTCPPGMTRCRGLCVDTLTNPSCCGTAMTTCGPNQTCRAGSCVCIDSKYTPCGSECVNTKTDANHCGGCGSICGPTRYPADSTCQMGVCQCSGGKEACVVGGKQQCVSTKDNNSHCGMCNRACLPGEHCMGTTCVSPWTKLTVEGSTPLYGVAMAGSMTAYAIGNSRQLFVYEPATGSFAGNDILIAATMKIFTGAPQLGIWAFSANDIVAAGRNGVLLKKTDMGWFEEPPVKMRHYLGVAGLAPAAMGNPIEVYGVSEDAALTQIRGNVNRVVTDCPLQTALGRPLRAVSVLRAGTRSIVHAAGDTSVAMRAEFEMGVCKSWRSQQVIDVTKKQQFQVRAIAMVSDKTVLAGGAAGLLLRSTDGGENWQERRSGGLELNSLASCGSTQWAVGNGGTLLVSQDAGMTWSSEAVAGVSQDLYGVACIDDVLLVVGNGIALKRTLK